MSATGLRARSGLLERLRARHGRRAGIAALGVLLLLLLHNAFLMVWNQRELPRRRVRELETWFQVSPRDIEKLARANPQPGVYGLMDIWYFLGKRIGSAHLTVPEWMAWSRWELEKVSGLEIAVAPEPLRIGAADARRLRGAGESRIYQRGTRSRRWFQTLYLIHDPAAKRYVVAEWRRGKQLFVLPEAQFAALAGVESAGP